MLADPDLYARQPKRFAEATQALEAAQAALHAAEEQWLAAGSVEVKGKGLMDTHVWMMPPGFMQAPVNAAAAVGAGWCTEVTAAAAAGVVKDAESDNGLSRHSSDSLLIKLFSSSART